MPAPADSCTVQRLERANYSTKKRQCTASVYIMVSMYGLENVPSIHKPEQAQHRRISVRCGDCTVHSLYGAVIFFVIFFFAFYWLIDWRTNILRLLLVCLHKQRSRKKREIHATATVICRIMWCRPVSFNEFLLRRWNRFFTLLVMVSL
jgi:Fe2+ transport system protein B